MRATWPETASYEVQVELVAPNGNYYYLPYGMVSLQNEGESLTRVKDSYMNSMGPGTQYAVSAVALPDWEPEPEPVFAPEPGGGRKPIPAICPGYLSPGAGGAGGLAD